ncbi:MAG: hypothetical protein HRU07_03950 [Nitrosopumilus sp.]|nr:hypothetical protein [Nitrosopumilus sp.]NRA05308.1 hypothetical protein [Nitrosopumilus sp.]
MSLIKYEELSDFQKWLFFYLAKNGYAPQNMKGIMPGMCSGLKMKIDLENFDQEEEKFRVQSGELYKNGLLTIITTRNPNGEYIISDKGEVYLLQKVLGPIIKTQDKNMTSKILDYFANAEPGLRPQIVTMLQNIDKRTFMQSVTALSTKMLTDFMPWMHAIDKIHAIAKSFGIDPSSTG